MNTLESTPPESMSCDSSIETIGNEIFFYSEVSKEKILQLTKCIKQLTNTILQREIELNIKNEKIYLHINSFGGELNSGLTMTDNILNNKVPITTVIDGSCMSAATLFSIVGKERYINQNAVMLIHQLSGIFWGTYNQMQDAFQNNTLQMQMVKTIYSKYTKLPKRKIDQLLKRDLMLTSKQCLEYGLVDYIGSPN